MQHDPRSQAQVHLHTLPESYETLDQRLAYMTFGPGRPDDREASSGDAHVSQNAAWGVSDKEIHGCGQIGMISRKRNSQGN